MKITGIKTVEERVVVEIEKEELLALMYKLLKKKYPKFNSFYSMEGTTLYTYSYIYSYNNDDEICDSRAATSEEIEIYKLAASIKELIEGGT